ncbi:MAG: hypothetical protein GY864_05250, partial [Desulfobacterales bacterium]|nr:hypothetical protein [Desulfobacterales bacterium]
MNTFIDSVIKQYKLVIVITLLITIAIGCFFSNLKLNNTIDMYFEEDDPAVKIHREFRETFGNEEMVLVLFKDDNIFSNKKIEIIRSISKMAKEMKYVHRVFSITEQEEAISEKDTIFFKKIIPEGILDQDTLAEVRQSVLNNKILLQRFISRDGTTTAIMVELDHIGNSGEKIALLNNIKESALKIAGTM